MIPGSKSEVHIKVNIDIFDFTLTVDKMKEIDSLNKDVRYYVSSEEALANYAAH